MGNTLIPGRPFTPESARLAAQRSAEIRREKRVTRVRYAETLDYLAETFGDRNKIGPLAFAAAARLMVAAVEGDIPMPETPLDRLRLAETARILHSIGRLEVGESTSNIAHASALSVQERAARLNELRARLAQWDDASN